MMIKAGWKERVICAKGPGEEQATLLSHTGHAG